MPHCSFFILTTVIQPGSLLYKVQLFSLGLWFALQGTIILMTVAYLPGKTGNFIKNNQKFWGMLEKVTSIILIGLGIKVALSSRK